MQVEDSVMQLLTICSNKVYFGSSTTPLFQINIVQEDEIKGLRWLIFAFFAVALQPQYSQSNKTAANPKNDVLRLIIIFGICKNRQITQPNTLTFVIQHHFIQNFQKPKTLKPH